MFICMYVKLRLQSGTPAHLQPSCHSAAYVCIYVSKCTGGPYMYIYLFVYITANLFWEHGIAFISSYIHTCTCAQAQTNPTYIYMTANLFFEHGVASDGFGELSAPDNMYVYMYVRTCTHTTANLFSEHGVASDGFGELSACSLDQSPLLHGQVRGRIELGLHLWCVCVCVCLCI